MRNQGPLQNDVSPLVPKNARGFMDQERLELEANLPGQDDQANRTVPNGKNPSNVYSRDRL